LHLAGHRLLIDGATVNEILVGFGRRKTLSRPSIKTRASASYLGTIISTTAIAINAASTVGRTICHLLRQSAAPSAGRSDSASPNWLPPRAAAIATPYSFRDSYELKTRRRR